MNTPVAYGQKSLSVLELNRGQEKSVSALVADMRKDAYVRLAERDIAATVATAQVSVSTESSDPRAIALAATLDELWRTHVPQMLESIAYGRAAFECVYTYVPGIGINTVLRLEPLPYDDTEPYFPPNGTGDGKPAGVVLGGGPEPLELCRPYGWWLALDATAMNPFGVSMFQGAMEDVWRRRCALIQKLATFIKKYSLGTTVAYADPTRTGPNGTTVNQWDEIAEAYAAADGGDLLIFPAATEQNSDGTSRKKVEINREEVGAKDGTPLMSLSKELGSEILLAACIPPRTLIEGDSGSFALVTWQMLVKYAVVEDKLSQIGQQFQTEVIDQAQKLNGVSGVEFNFVPLTQRPDDLVTEIVKGWMQQPALSPLVSSGAVDVRQMLEMSGIPLGNVSPEMLAKLAVQTPANPPGPVQMAAPLSPSFRHLMRG